jgi:hypothetical protein
MAQLTIYLDEDTVRRVERAAKQSGSSVSAWVKERLTDALDDRWPPGFFDLFGTLRDQDLERPAQLDPALDIKRHRP